MIPSGANGPGARASRALLRSLLLGETIIETKLDWRRGTRHPPAGLGRPRRVESGNGRRDAPEPIESSVAQPIALVNARRRMRGVDEALNVKAGIGPPIQAGTIIQRMAGADLTAILAEPSRRRLRCVLPTSIAKLREVKDRYWPDCFRSNGQCARDS